MAENEPDRPDDVRELDHEDVLPVVVGAHLESEIAERPIAYRLCASIATWQKQASAVSPLRPVVLTDLWYLNHQTLRLRPTISLGRPEVNAVTAYLAARVPTVLAVDDAYRIQLDPELIDLHACLWGPTPADTAKAVERFQERYLEDFLENVHLLRA